VKSPIGARSTTSRLTTTPRRQPRTQRSGVFQVEVA